MALKLDRPINLRCMGDWGDANLHRVLGWLSSEVVLRSPPGTVVTIRNGLAGVDAVAAVADGEVDIAMATPVSHVLPALKGEGRYDKPYPTLRGLAVIPQFDRLILGVRTRLGLSSITQIREQRFPLRIALSSDDGVQHFGYAGHRILEAHGISVDDITGWGGKVVYADRPDLCFEHYQNGEVDAVLHEAMMMHRWRTPISQGELMLLPFEQDALSEVEEKYKLPPAVVPAGYYPEIKKDIAALEFSDFLMFCSTELPDDIAYFIAAAMVQTRARLEQWYAHVPRERCPVTWPLSPVAMAETLIPLHPGAARYYREAGIRG